MKRKLCSVLLSAFALLLLMGAADAPEQAELILAQEESAAVSDSAALETDSEIQFEVNDVEETGEESQSSDVNEETQPGAEQTLVQTDEQVLIDGQPAPMEIKRVLRDGTTHVSLAGMAKALDANVSIQWDGVSGTVTVNGANLNLTARVGDRYVVANGRYLYVAEKVSLTDGTVMVPMSVVTEAFDARLTWDGATGKILVQRGTGALVAAEAYYNQDDLFWLSRVIHAESGGESLEGKMAVGNVVLNRVASPIFPNSVKAVLAQRNQFSTYKGGALANRTPNAESVIAAKLVMDGGVVEEVEDALWFDAKCRNSWAARHKATLAVIGGHKFYG